MICCTDKLSFERQEWVYQKKNIWGIEIKICYLPLMQYVSNNYGCRQHVIIQEETDVCTKLGNCIAFCNKCNYLENILHGS